LGRAASCGGALLSVEQMGASGASVVLVWPCRGPGALSPGAPPRRAPTRKGNHRQELTSKARSGVARVVLEVRTWLKRQGPYGGEGMGAPCCLSGTGAPLVGVRMTREVRLPPVPGQARLGQAQLTDPLQMGHNLHVSQWRTSTVPAGGSSQRKVKQAWLLTRPLSRLCRACTKRQPTLSSWGSHRSMVWVRLPAWWLAARAA
jgi:hypothetical protein